MPQAPTANMGIIWPSDHGDGDAWDQLMDQAVRVVIDGHDHSAGNGVQVKQSQISIDADISWVSAGGTQRAITDLKAIDFAPQAAANVAGLAGAFFLNSADNEIYVRTFGGANVKLTNGAALNFATFVGGIGGDYASVAALLSFVDANDTYLFQQQIGGGVRQYGKIQSADLQLFEFKANPTVGVPAFSVTIKSPAALAANYVLTLPTALPASTLAMQSDNTGQFSFSNAFAGPLSFSVLAPAALSAGNNNNYNPTGMSTAVIVRLATAGGGPFITGIAGGSSGRVVHLYNTGADTIVFTHLDGSSTAANQFITPTAASMNLATNQSMTWVYDSTSSKWRLDSKNF